MALDPSRRFPLMAITQNGSALGHAEQAERLCDAGVRWIQLRMKEAPRDAWLATAVAVAATCRRYGAICVINDSVDIALEAGADGVHLGRTDLAWNEARRLLGPGRILGGTVNFDSEAEAAARCGCLDYVGVGPLRFTRTKKELAPLRGFEGIERLVGLLRGIPAWAIGGIEASDVARLRPIGVAGTAVCSALSRDGRYRENARPFLEAWPFPSPSIEAGADAVSSAR